MTTPTSAMATPPPPPSPPAAAAAPAAPSVPGPPGAAAPQAPQSASRAALQGALAGTPGRLRGLAVLTVLATLVFGLAAGQAFRSANGALERAAANSDQVVRIQAIQTNVVQADAVATNAFLVGGLEPATQREAYTTAIATASGLIAEAAQHQPADGAALAALNTTLVSYAGQIELARANNRQGLPIGSQYLRAASADLRAEALPLLANLGEANDARVAEEFSRAGRALWWLVVPGLMALVVLGLALAWIARRTRRYVNVPLAGAALVVLTTLVAGAVGLLAVKADVDDTRDGVYAATRSMAVVRTAGFDAKANESLTLIARGSGAAFQEAWLASSEVVGAELTNLEDNPAGGDLDPQLWADYVAVHEEIRALDDSGDWDGAVELATGTGDGTGNTTFAAFDEASAGELDALSRQTANQLDETGGWLPVAGVLGVLVGLLAAGLSWWGISQRLEEYR
ncbi:MAG TPA: hypothetical protein VLA70_04910 [Nocardioides sp.]|nr:hypothetical protein [Nocardioides sp.]